MLLLQWMEIKCWKSFFPSGSQAGQEKNLLMYVAWLLLLPVLSRSQLIRVNMLGNQQQQQQQQQQ